MLPRERPWEMRLPLVTRRRIQANQLSLHPSPVMNPLSAPALHVPESVIAVVFTVAVIAGPEDMFAVRLLSLNDAVTLLPWLDWRMSGTAVAVT